jgi:hypothetical protein
MSCICENWAHDNLALEYRKRTGHHPRCTQHDADNGSAWAEIGKQMLYAILLTLTALIVCAAAKAVIK